MAGIKRLQAVPVVFVWIALCFPGPAAALGTTSVQVREAAFAVVLCAPCGPDAQLVRAKANKPLVFSSACVAPPQTSEALALGAVPLRVCPAHAAPNFRLTCPPLAPRPPPAA